MRAYTKFGIGVFCFVIVLVGVFFIPLGTAGGLEKVNIGNKTIRIQTTEKVPVVDVQLIENTRYCLIDCYAILRIHPYRDISLPSSQNDEFRWEFIKERHNMLGLSSYNFKVLRNISYFATVYEYGEVTYYYERNSTIPSDCWGYNETHYACNVTEIVGSHKEIRYRQEYKPFNFWGKVLHKDKDYYIKLEGKKHAQLGANNIEWIPTIKNFKISEWAWWNSTWTRKKPINISVSSGTTEKNYTVMLNVSYDSDMQSDFGDLRFLNGSENAELPYWVEYNVTSNYAYVWVKIDQNITTTNYTIYMYYGNEDADTTSEGMDTFEMFDDFNNLTYWTQQSGTWNATDGVMNSPDALGSASYLKYNYSVRNDNYSIHLRFRVNDGSAVADKRIFLLLNGNSTLKYDEAYEPCYYQSYSRIYSDYNVPSWSVSDFDLSAWYYGEIKFQTSGTNVTHAELYYDNNKTHIGNHSMDGNLDHQGHYFGFLAIYAFFSVDYVFMRKYQLPEPTYAFGTEIHDTSPPNITIWHPENTTYNTTSIDLNWTTNETLDWCAYSLNGSANVSFTNEGQYTGDSFDTSGSGNLNPLGITQNGTYFWIVDYDNSEVYKYWMNGTYTGEYWNTTVENNDPYGITQNGTYIWVSDVVDAKVYKYLMDGTYIESWDTSGQSRPTGITQNGTYFWITDSTSKKVYKYWMNGTYTGEHWDTAVDGIYVSPTGITQNGTYFWILFENSEVYKYWMNGTYTGEHWNAVGGLPYPTGITQNGTYFWIVDNFDKEVYIYFINGTYTGEHWDTAMGGIFYPYSITQNCTHFWIVNYDICHINIYTIKGTDTGDEIDVYFESGGANSFLLGVTQNGTYIWTTDYYDSEVYKYWMNGTYTGEHWDTAGSGNEDPVGITQNGTYFWIVDNFDKEVYIYFINGTYTGEHWDTAGSGNEDPVDITQNGKYFWITDSTSKKVYKYWMNGTYTGEHWDTEVDGIYVSPTGITQNGKYFWIVDYDNSEVYKYYFGNFKKCINTTIIASEGHQNITVWGNDSSGNMASDTVWFTVDTTPPTVTIDSPTNGSFYNTSLTINGTTSDLHKDSCWLNDTSFNSSIINVSSTGTFNFSNASNLVDGTTYYITVICNDTVNNTNYTTVYFTYDVSGPNITTPLIYHDNTQYTSILRGSNITVKVNITDATGIDNNSVILNITDPNGVNKVYANMINTTSITNGYIFEYNVTVYLNWTNGTYSVNITANDTFNQTGLNSTQLNIYKLTITEGSVIQGDAEINKTTKWQRTDSVYNPLATSYTNFIANTSIVSDVVWYELWNDTDNHTDDILTVNLTGNCIEWLISNITATETQSWNLYYNTTIINYTKYNETVGGVWYFYLNVTNNVTNITDVYAYSDVYEINRTYVLEELISGTWTDRTDNASYTFRNIDTDGDDSYDKVSWYVPLLDGLRQFRAYISYIVVVENKTITNPPVTEFKPINWLNEVTLKNVDTVSHSYSIKIYLPYDAVNIRVDDVSTEPKYDANGRYVTLTGTLAGGSQIIHEIEYSTPPTSVTVTIDYPDVFWVDEKAIINMNVSVKNWASQNITDVEKSITIDYGEELYLCEDFVSVCNESNAIDSADIVSGTYVLEIGNMTPFEIHNYTISYLIYTAWSEEKPSYKDTINTTIFNVNEWTIKSICPIPMQSVKLEIPDINCSNVVRVINSVTEEELEWSCGSLIVNLGSIGQGSVINIKVYSIIGPAPEPINWLVELLRTIIIPNFLGLFDLEIWHVLVGITLVIFIIVCIRFDFKGNKRIKRVIRRIRRNESDIEEYPTEEETEEEQYAGL